jgi:Domain of unknown function (DUF4411)
MAYLLDANVFIQAKNLHYGLDFCPAFWEWLIANNKGANVFSIEKVGDEIAAGGDDLSDWAGNCGDGFFLKPDAALLPALGTVSAWANGQNYEPAAVNTFLQWRTIICCICSCARTHGCHARDRVRLDQAHQNSKCLYWIERQVHDALRDAAPRACALHLGSSAIGLEIFLFPVITAIASHYISILCF